MNYKDKLRHNFGSLSTIDKIIYLLFIRIFQSKKNRLFFEGSFILPGQMLRAEREALYNIVIESKPDFCFEIGTYTGGGSTFFISKGLKDNNKGKLLTTESNDFLYNKAKKRYRKYIKEQYPFIDFINSSSQDNFKKYLAQNDKNFMIFLDGAEDGKQTLDQYEFFRPYFKNGTIIALHDWNTEKTKQVKPLILQDKNLINLIELDKPESVGFAIFKYIKKV